VAMDQVKRWAEVIEVDDDIPDQELMSEPEATNDMDTDDNVDENLSKDQGFYNVECILKQNFRQGWRFLTKWENFFLTASTWEPTRSFVLPDGRVFQPFKEYCQAKGLNGILKQLKAEE